MTIQEMVRADFKEFIDMDPTIPRELKQALKHNERVPLFFDNLSHEIRKAETVLILRGQKLDRMKIKMMVQSLAAYFVMNVKALAEQQMMSDAEKTRIKEQAEGTELEKKFDNEGNADLTEEFGLRIVDRGQTE